MMNMQFTLEDNHVAILDPETREVEVIHIPDLDDVEDLAERLEELGYNTNSILFMS